MFFFFLLYGHHRDLHSFPTRRSSDLYFQCHTGPSTHLPAACERSTTPQAQARNASIFRHFRPAMARARTFSAPIAGRPWLRRERSHALGWPRCPVQPGGAPGERDPSAVALRHRHPPACRGNPRRAGDPAGQDRKSTRLNSSHLVISYAVFCLKKKKKTHTISTVINVDM